MSSVISTDKGITAFLSPREICDLSSKQCVHLFSSSIQSTLRGMRAVSWFAANVGCFALHISLSAAKRDSSLGLSKQNLHKNGVAIGKPPSIEALTCD